MSGLSIFSDTSFDDLVYADASTCATVDLLVARLRGHGQSVDLPHLRLWFVSASYHLLQEVGNDDTCADPYVYSRGWSPSFPPPLPSAVCLILLLLTSRMRSVHASSARSKALSLDWTSIFVGNLDDQALGLWIGRVCPSVRPLPHRLHQIRKKSSSPLLNDVPS